MEGPAGAGERLSGGSGFCSSLEAGPLSALVFGSRETARPPASPQPSGPQSGQRGAHDTTKHNKDLQDDLFLVHPGLHAETNRVGDRL